MKRITHHPAGVIVDGKLYLRDDFYSSPHVTLREWLAFGVLILGLVAWIAAVAWGLVWLVSEVLHRWH